MSSRLVSFPDDLPFTRAEIATYYSLRFGIDLKREETRVPCPVHKGQGANLSINADSGRAKCHSGCSRGWDIPALETELFGGGKFPEVKKRIFELVGRSVETPKRAGNPTEKKAFSYTDADGNLLYQNVRFEPGANGKPKTFKQRAPKVGGGWVYSVKGISRVPFQLPLVVKAKRVVVTEGEKDARTVTNLGIVGTTNSGGATHWTGEEAAYLYGKDLVVVCGDNDEPGRKHVAVVAESLAGRVGSLRILQVPSAFKDVTAWVEGGANAQDIEVAIAQAPEYTAGEPKKKEQAPTADWANELITNEKGQPRALLVNAIAAFRGHPDFAGKFYFNEFLICSFVRGRMPWDAKEADRVCTDRDDLQAAEWLQRHGIHVSPDIAAQAIEVVAGDRPYHPVREYLDGLKWDGIRRLDTWLTKYIGVAPSKYSSAVGKRWCISAIARIRKPGSKADCVPIFEGPQGIQKSTAIATIALKWFTDELSDLGSKDAAMQTAGVWIIELSELDALSRGDAARIKAFLSRTTDRFRPPYGRRTVEVPRQCVFAGSVNGNSYLTDETGNRRFWPVACGRIDIEGLRDIRDQLWAEADDSYRNGEVWWLDTAELRAEAESAQSARYALDSWDDVIAHYCADREGEEIIVSKILNEVFNISVGRQTRSDFYRLGRALTRLQWTRFQKRLPNGVREWRYRLSPIANK